ncbi:MAG TPA: iron-sulfur cluster carrier protein ApbC [Candidatus Latescibacteria bacterium]|nr:iron-sulfur cluster carrier protein ApbC [Candidatus Latescibacterota bacterium]HOF60025.1 iron-sulfur cluster carrier protein ApbC [Candidatus Latescibacterota bacterium]HOS63308.1 iron-sulfur cluster carrier protein ApbC [Candidatus Latescibacterota bacterium]HPK74509.1 iron-sulfur cluster carrier protein ApbC [Candidatus Latescibacterota bacterium]
MPEVTKEMVVEALSKVNDPELHRDLVSLGMIRDVAVTDGAVKFTLALTTMACPLKSRMQEDCKTAVMRIPGVREVTIDVTADTPRNARPASGKKVGDIVLQDMLPTVKNAIAVASGKGGVGKSTVSVNIAAALAMEGARVGLLDADIYGPSIPIMMGVTEQPEITDSEEIIPIRKYGIELMSIGFVIPEEQSVIWRGPMVAKMLQQFLSGVKWGELDYLIVDLPPGTGDAQLTLTQSVPLAGGLIVSTPQAVALADVRRGITMFKKVDVPILGVVENMSTFVCPKCGHEEHIFAYGGARSEAEKLGVPFLGEIPIDLSIREGGDSGVPVVVAHPDSPVGLAFRKLARDAAAAVSVSNLTARKAERHEPARTGKELPMMK